MSMLFRLFTAALLTALSIGEAASAGQLCRLRLEDLTAIGQGSDNQMGDALFSKRDQRKQKRYLKIKRMIDVTLATLSMPIVLPVITIAGAAVRLEDPSGPAIFRQDRYGRGKETFEIYKIRTMRNAPPSNEDRAYKTLENDPRVTRVGKILRALKIDELPQIFNVLKGDMSLVGPRPLVVAEVEAHEVKIPGYRLRHEVTPGLTGYSRLESTSTVIDGVAPQDAFEIDLYYIHNRTIGFDLLIMLRTVGHVATTAIPEIPGDEPLRWDPQHVILSPD